MLDKDCSSDAFLVIHATGQARCQASLRRDAADLLRSSFINVETLVMYSRRIRDGWFKDSDFVLCSETYYAHES